MWSRPPLTGWSRKHPGCVGQPRRTRKRARHSSPPVNGTGGGCPRSDMERQRSACLRAKAPPARRGAGGRHRRPDARKSGPKGLTGHEVHRNESPEAGASVQQRPLHVPARANGAGAVSWRLPHANDDAWRALRSAPGGFVDGHAPRRGQTPRTNKHSQQNFSWN